MTIKNSIPKRLRTSGYDDFGIRFDFQSIQNPYLNYLKRNCLDFNLRNELVKEKYDNFNLKRDAASDYRLYIIGEPKNSGFEEAASKFEPKLGKKINFDEIYENFKSGTSPSSQVLLSNVQSAIQEKLEGKLNQETGLLCYNLLLATYLKNLDQRVQKKMILLTAEPKFALTLSKLNQSTLIADVNTLELSTINAVLHKDIDSTVGNYKVYCNQQLAPSEPMMNIIFGMYLLQNSLDDCLSIATQMREQKYQVNVYNLIRFINRSLIEGGAIPPLKELVDSRDMQKLENCINEYLNRKLEIQDNHLASKIYGWMQSQSLKVEDIPLAVLKERQLLNI